MQKIFDSKEEAQKFFKELAKTNKYDFIAIEKMQLAGRYKVIYRLK